MKLGLRVSITRGLRTNQQRVDDEVEPRALAVVYHVRAGPASVQRRRRVGGEQLEVGPGEIDVVQP